MIGIGITLKRNHCRLSRGADQLKFTCQRIETMQPNYLYSPDFDREIQWRSSFSAGIPVFLGLLQMLLTFAIIGLEIASVVISPVYGTLYAGFWGSVVFTLSWVSMIGLVCCHRARKWATFVFFVSLLCAAVAITLIVLDALFIANITRCFFAKVICDDLLSTYPRGSSQPLGRKVLVLKGQIACAALLLATALLYMLFYLLASRSLRRTNRVVIEHHHPVQQRVVRRVVREPSPPPSPRPSWKTASIPVTYEPSELECPHCRSLIRLSQR